MKRILSIIFLTLAYTVSYAQFYVTGDDPGKTRWYSVDTDNYTIIYPEGNDSLARVYGKNLEMFRIPVSRTTGYLPDGGRRIMPVMLHSFNSSNGSVAWAPKRMDLFTIPSAYCPEPMPWDRMLAVHESRHITQMQFAMTEALRPGNWIFGEMFNILASIIYPRMSVMEGDAVITETAYSNSGRGRTADFLNYYRVAFDEGVRRNWVQWRFSSQRNYGPDHYALGYMTVGGIRHFHDFPDYMDQAYHIAARRPYRLGIFNSLAKDKAGKKRFNDVFLEIADSMAVIWKEEADARAPYIPMEPVTKEPRLYTDFTSNVFIDNNLYSIKAGHLDAPALVRIDEDGEDSMESRFSSHAGKIKSDGRRIFWSETYPDERWSMQTHSKIRVMEGDLIKDDKRLLYNPAPSPDGKTVACVEYFVKGGSASVIVDASEGIVTESLNAPEGVQLVETAWIGNDLYASAVSDGGYSILKIDHQNDSFMTVIGPEPVMIKDFGSYADELIFTCDRTGSNELYHLDPKNGRLVQKTSIRHGGESFAYSPDGKWLYFSSQTVKGKRIFRTETASLMNREADLSERHTYMLAEALADQEEKIASERGEDLVPPTDVRFSDPVRYRKFPHMFNVHSWAPVYVSVDNIMNMSFDYIYQAASAGVSGIIQNRLSTATGEFGYSAHRDPYNPGKWRHSGHAKLRYTGLYPAFELSVDINDRSARQYNPTAYLTDGGNSLSVTSKEMDNPYVQASAKVYVPLNFTSGGWTRGLIPQVSYTVTNDFFNTSLPVISYKVEDGAIGMNGPVFMGAREGRNGIMQYLSGSVRGYTMLRTSNSCVYPRWGIGAELGVTSIPTALDYYSPMGYAYAYGYVPGIIRSHGMKLTAMYLGKLSDAPFGQMSVSILPRGFTGNGMIGSALATHYDSLFKITADYGMPIYIGDISLMNSFFYLKRLVLTPHFDYMFAQRPSNGLWSAGCTLALDLESILWLEWPCSFGVSASVNGGPAFVRMKNDYSLSRYNIGPVFNVTF